jgi:cytochrome c biogenesis protein CcdA
MLLLIAFALLAGAGTALSPCVLPVLPALLSAGGVGGRRRPLGVVLGLTITFTVTIVGVADVVNGVGLGSDPLRYIAIGVLLLAGLVLLVPAIGSRRGCRGSPRSGPAALATRGMGFAPGCSSAARSASSTHPAPARSSRP